MKKLLVSLLICMPLAMTAQTQNDRVAELQAEAAAKAKAAQEAAAAAQEAARAAQEAAEAAAAEARKAAVAAEQEAKVAAEQAAQEQTARNATAKKAAEEAIIAEKMEEEATKVAEEATVTTPTATSQKNWTIPTAPASVATAPKKSAEVEKDAERDKVADIYLATDAVPVVNDEVRWTYDINVPGKDAQQLYQAALQAITNITQEEGQLERSRVALVNESEHKIVATMQEWLVFTSSALSLDRTKFNYILQANCSNGHVQLVLDHVTYSYATQGKAETYKAEEWITDKHAVNKKRTRLYPLSGKFRRKTIDRKNALFADIEAALK